MSDNTQSNYLLEAKKKWLDLIDALPESVQGVSQPMSKDDITKWFDVVIIGVRRLENEIVDTGLMSLYWPGVASSIANVQGHMTNAVANGAPWLLQTTNALMGYLWTIRSSLPWLLVDSEERVNTTTLPLLGELIAHAREITDASARVMDAEVEISSSLASAKADEEALKITVTNTVALERKAQTAATNAAASSVAAEAEKSKVDQYVEALQAAETAQKTLFEEFETRREQIDAILHGASKVAMARSFQERRIALTSSQTVWRNIFIAGIASLAVIGYFLGVQLIESIQSSQAAASEGHLLAMVLMFVRFLVLAPFVWLTWFAARQYGHLLRLTEDYAFKEAAAHAFIGYRTEMGEDSDMLHLLREYAINNFGANPIRTLSKNEPATPLNDILDRTLGKISPDKLTDLIMAAIKKDGK